MIKNFILFFLVLFSFYSLKSATYTAIGCPGPVTWSAFSAAGSPFWNGALQLKTQPATGDILIIPSGCTVSITAGVNITNSITLSVYGTLNFSSAGSSLDMNSGSLINVYSSGKITGVSNSNQIKIGNGAADLVANGTFPGPFVVNSTGTVSTVPIELTSFNTTCYSEGVQLNWTTATEINNDYFVIERSEDALTWETIAKIKGNGTSLETHKYIHEDVITFNSVLYYRLKQVDFDGKTTIHKIAYANCNLKMQNEMLIYPNPASTELNVYFRVSNPIKKANLIVLNLTGQIVFESHIELNQGINTFNFPLDLQLGTYQVLISSDDLSIPSQKIVVLKS